MAGRVAWRIPKDWLPELMSLHWMQWQWLRVIPGIGRLRALRPGSDALVGVLVDAFTAFAMLDKQLKPAEADLILDLLRSAFPGSGPRLAEAAPAARGTPSDADSSGVLRVEDHPG